MTLVDVPCDGGINLTRVIQSCRLLNDWLVSQATFGPGSGYPPAAVSLSPRLFHAHRSHQSTDVYTMTPLLPDFLAGLVQNFTDRSRSLALHPCVSPF